MEDSIVSNDKNKTKPESWNKLNFAIRLVRSLELEGSVISSDMEKSNLLSL